MDNNWMNRVNLLLLAVGLFAGIWAGWLIGEKTSSKAFGGQFAPQMAQQQAGRYQIAGCDANSAWIIDTAMGDVFLMYSNGKWKEIGSLMDEKKRIRAK